MFALMPGKWAHACELDDVMGEGGASGAAPI
jgi:hypothetical protein